MEEDESMTSEESEQHIRIMDYGYKERKPKPIAKAQKEDQKKVTHRSGQEEEEYDLNDAMRNIGAKEIKSLKEMKLLEMENRDEESDNDESSCEENWKLNEIIDNERKKEKRNAQMEKEKQRKEKQNRNTVARDILQSYVNNEKSLMRKRIMKK